MIDECDDEDVALRALCLHATRGKWKDLEEFGVVRSDVEMSMTILSDTYGPFSSRGWYDEERMGLLRSVLPSLIPAAQSLRGVYLMKKSLERKMAA